MDNYAVILTNRRKESLTALKEIDISHGQKEV